MCTAPRNTLSRTHMHTLSRVHTFTRRGTRTALRRRKLEYMISFHPSMYCISTGFSDNIPSSADISRPLFLSLSSPGSCIFVKKTNNIIRTHVYSSRQPVDTVALQFSLPSPPQQPRWDSITVSALCRYAKAPVSTKWGWKLVKLQTEVAQRQVL
jgi:hypothetical protein